MRGATKCDSADIIALAERLDAWYRVQDVNPLMTRGWQVGDRVILSTGASLAGHCVIDDKAIIGGQVGIRQRVRIGAHAMVGGMSAVLADVVPFTVSSPAHAAYMVSIVLMWQEFEFSFSAAPPFHFRHNLVGTMTPLIDVLLSCWQIPPA